MINPYQQVLSLIYPYASTDPEMLMLFNQTSKGLQKFASDSYEKNKAEFPLFTQLHKLPGHCQSVHNVAKRIIVYANKECIQVYNYENNETIILEKLSDNQDIDQILIDNKNNLIIGRLVNAIAIWNFSGKLHKYHQTPFCPINMVNDTHVYYQSDEKWVKKVELENPSVEKNRGKCLSNLFQNPKFLVADDAIQRVFFYKKGFIKAIDSNNLSEIYQVKVPRVKAYSKKNHWLIYPTANSLQIFDALNNKPLRILQINQDEAISYLKFDDRTDILISISQRAKAFFPNTYYKITLYDTKLGTIVYQMPLEGVANLLEAVLYLPHCNMLVGVDKSCILIWNLLENDTPKKIFLHDFTINQISYDATQHKLIVTQSNYAGTTLQIDLWKKF